MQWLLYGKYYVKKALHALFYLIHLTTFNIGTIHVTHFRDDKMGIRGVE